MSSQEAKKSIFALTDYEKVLLNINKCGDSLVMDIAFIENTDTTYQFTEIITRTALDFLQKRHPFLRAFINLNSDLEVQSDNYSAIELEWSDNNITRSELITELEIFNSKMFDFKPKSNLSRCKVSSFNDSGFKMYSVSLSMSLVITGKPLLQQGKQKIIVIF